MLESASLQRTESDPPVRTLKIEADGDRWKGIRPKIPSWGVGWSERDLGRAIACTLRVLLPE